MLVDDIILAGRRLTSFIEKLEPTILDKLAPNAIRSKRLLATAINDLNNTNLDVFILIIRYYKTLSIAYRDELVKSLDVVIKLDNTADIEIINYTELSDVDKIIFEIIYTLTIMSGNI